MKTKVTFVSLLLTLGVFFLVGCDQLTREHYEMITVNVDKEFDVDKMIGEPDSKISGLWLYEREDKHLVVKIEFDDDGVVTRKEWIDAMGGTWDDSQESGDDSVYESTTIRKSRK